MQTLQAIITRVLPQTNKLPKRYKATLGNGVFEVTISEGDGTLSDDELHRKALDTLCEKVKWKTPATPDGKYSTSREFQEGRMYQQRVWVYRDTDTDVDMLRAQGYAVCIYTPEELTAGHTPILVKEMEAHLAEQGNQLINSVI